MNVRVFNACMAAGWLAASVGAGLWWLPGGLMFGGVSLVLLTLAVARMAGGLR
jgi:hypothetical protein